MGAASRVCTSCDTPLPDDAAFCPTCGAAIPTQSQELIPSDFQQQLTTAIADRYRIERELGRGGMAIVYLAHDVRHERQVAVKVLRPELAASVGTDRFLREIKLAAKLTHHSILALYDSGEADGFLYYVMPYVDGESLRQKLNRERQLAIDEALRLTQEIAEGLDYANEQGIIHRDIKPENILLSRGHALIADFGIAKAVAKEGAPHLTSTGTSVGTPLYMSPEQAAGDPHIDHRTDIYSLGCVLYEILAGEPPFTGPTVAAIMAKHAIEPRPSVRTVRDTVPETVDVEIQRAMARVAADRCTSASAFAAAIASSAPAPAVPAGPTGAEHGHPQESLLHRPEMADVVAYDPKVREIMRIPRARAPVGSIPKATRRVNPWLIGGALAALVLAVGVTGIFTLSTGGPFSQSGLSSASTEVPMDSAAATAVVGDSAGPPPVAQPVGPPPTTAFIDASPRLMVGADYFSLRRFDDAIVTFRAVGTDERVRLDDRRVAFALLARAYLEAGSPDSARTAVADLLNLEPPLIVLLPPDINAPLAQTYFEVRRGRVPYVAGSRGSDQDTVVIAVLPFAVFHEGTEHSRDLSEGLQAALVTELVIRSGDAYRVVDRVTEIGRVEPLTRMIPQPLRVAAGASHGDWRVLDQSKLPAQWMRATHYVLGTAVLADERVPGGDNSFLLNAWVYDARGQLSTVASASGLIDELLRAGVEELAGQLRSRIQELVPRD